MAIPDLTGNHGTGIRSTQVRRSRRNGLVLGFPGETARDCTQGSCRVAQIPVVLVIEPTELPAGEVGTAYSQTLTADGTAPLTWTLTGGPVGMELDESTGELTWANPVAGSHEFTVTVEDSDGHVGSIDYTLEVTEP